MDQNYYPHHPHFAHLHHPPQYLDQYDCQPAQEFYIPPPHTAAAAAAAASHQVVVCDATFEEASQHQQQQSFIAPTHHHHHFNAEEGGPIGWVPPEERGFQHQSASTNSIASNEVSSIASYPTVDHQQPQFAPTFQGQQQQPSTSNWASQQPAPDMGIYQMAGEAVSFHQEQQVQVPSSDVIPGPTQTQQQPQSTGIPQVAAAAQAPPIGMLAPQAVYHSSTLTLDPSATSPSISFHHQHSVGVGGTPGYPQPAVAQGYNDVQAQHLHEVTSASQSNSNLSFSTSSGASSTGTLIAPVPNASSSPSDSLYPVGMYTPCGSSESMAILNGEIPLHQQAAAQVPHQQQSQPHQLYSASGSYEVQSQYLAHQPPHPTSARAQTFHSGLSDSTSNFITSPTTPTHGAVVVQQPQPLAPSRTSSLAAWADVPPTPIVGPEHGPVMGPGVQEYHQHQQQYHHHPHPQYHHHADAVKEEEGSALQVYSPVQQQQPQGMKMEMVGQDAAYGAQEHAMKQQPVSPQAPTQPPHHPAMSRSATDGAVPRVQAQALSRSATVPDMSSSAAQRPSNNTAAAAAAALGPPTRSVAEFDIAPRPVEAIKASETVRQAAKLHVDVGQADPNSPTSHEARLKARSLRRKGSAAPPQHGYSPYHREFAARRGSSASQHDQAEQQQHAHPHQPVVPSSRPTTALPTDQYGAQRTFIFNPYQDPNALTAEGGKQGPIPHGVPLPTPGMVTAVVSGAPVAAQHQTIEFSGGAESMSPDELAKGKAIDRNPADAAALMMGEKKPFLACGFCRQRKIACGQRAPHPRDNEIGDGPRTCNQCARRHILCSFPSESRRGLRKTKPITKTIVQEDGSEVTITIEDEEEIEELEQQPTSSKKQSKSKKKGRGPMEWIIAADAWLITPAAWAAHKAAQDKKASEGTGSGPSSSSGAQMYQSAPLEDSPFPAVQV